MNAEDLKKLGLTDDELIQKIIVAHGKDIEKHKAQIDTAEAEVKSLKDQLSEAGKQIESFKGMDIDGVKKAAADWEAKARQAEADAAKQVAQLKFDHALDGALSGAKARNAKAVRALLNLDGLKLNEADGSVIGLKEQLEKIQSEADYLFESDEASPRVVTGATGKTTTTGDSFMAALRKGAGLPEEK